MIIQTVPPWKRDEVARIRATANVPKEISNNLLYTLTLYIDACSDEELIAKIQAEIGSWLKRQT